MSDMYQICLPIYIANVKYAIDSASSGSNSIVFEVDQLEIARKWPGPKIDSKNTSKRFVNVRPKKSCLFPVPLP